MRKKKEEHEKPNIRCPIVESYDGVLKKLVECGQNGTTGCGRFDVLEHLLETGLIEKIGERGWDYGYVQSVYRLKSFSGLPTKDKVYKSHYNKKTNIITTEEIVWENK